jgi:hypothetical protein
MQTKESKPTMRVIHACRGKKGGCLLISHESMIANITIYAKAA